MCAKKTASKHCVDIQDRETCLTSTESLHQIEIGRQIYDSDCAWCQSGPCIWPNINGTSRRCKPEFVVQVQDTEGYETCLKPTNITEKIDYETG